MKEEVSRKGKRGKVRKKGKSVDGKREKRRQRVVRCFVRRCNK